MTPIDQADRIISLARDWIGTPYHHQASLKGVGCDCLGLVRGVWRGLYGCEAEAVPAYSPDWGDASDAEQLLAAGRRHLIEIPIGDMGPGDVFALRWKGAQSAKHLGIVTSQTATGARFIHAYEKKGVIEVTLSKQWRAMIAAAFRFPDAKQG
ncbi:peptidase P60 [Cohaesibacter celericrescens]|uniref:Peptidase P60 n=1 Tax=Cohaesibacter celericrescens TaxID=2067669 RepID=A0A2N5XQV3_9HYPH|nr:peptidase P60 [Cohaesibacter celericrescens]PLW76798.1 peptidase P60 [Cohaesibacter celericrescens]